MSDEPKPQSDESEEIIPDISNMTALDMIDWIFFLGKPITDNPLNQDEEGDETEDATDE